jgi:hypothetical protein
MNLDTVWQVGYNQINTMAELVRSADALPKTNTDHIQLLLITDI